MNPKEFRDWMAYHAASNPTWARQADRASKHSIEAWQSLMIGVRFEHAKRATDDMSAGVIKRPFAVEEHITEIAKRAHAFAAAELAPRDTRVETYRCLSCFDSTFVSIVHPNSIERAQDGAFDNVIDWLRSGSKGSRPPMRGWTSAAVWCTCKFAQANRQYALDTPRREPGKPVPSPMPVFDTRRHIRWSNDLLSILEAAKNLKPVNFVPEFSEWNMTFEEVSVD